jgi:hypothetical protein
MTLVIENETETNIPNTLNGGIIPVGYHIYLQSNATMWIEVPMTILDNSKHPPVIPSEANNGFLRTNMPTIYGSTAIVIISATIALGVCYIVSIRHRTKQKLISINGQ